MAETVLNHTAAWVQNWIVRETLCPFAAPVVRHERLRYRLSEGADLEARYQHFLEEVEFLFQAAPTETETTIVVYPQGLEDFEEYLDFVATCEEALERAGLEGTFQIATFHPQYQFAEEEQDAPANFTNRSPYPMLHLLREASVSEAVEQHEDINQIPERNIQHLNQMGTAAILARMEEIRKLANDLPED